MSGVLQDLRYAVRMLTKSTGFAAVAVITLALGIAVNATMFSLVSAFLLQRPPGRDPEHVAVVSAVSPDQVYHADAFPLSAPNYLTWRDANHVFAEMAASDEDRTVSLTGRGQPEAIHSAAVTTNYFKVFGVSPALGRSFTGDEDQPGRNHVLILSHGLWQRRFGADPSMLGQTLRLNRENFVIIGIMPARFRLLGFTPQLWTPLTLSAADQTEAARQTRSLHLFARLKPGVTLAEARAELTTLAGRAEHDFPETEKGWRATVRTLPDSWPTILACAQAWWY
jgi:putative ABC transport system permease protein